MENQTIEYTNLCTYQECHTEVHSRVHERCKPKIIYIKNIGFKWRHSFFFFLKQNGDIHKTFSGN